MTDNTHEYRIMITVPMGGTARHMSSAKHQIAPIVDQALAAISGIELNGVNLAPIMTDGTVKLGRGKKGASPVSSEIVQATTATPEPLVAPVVRSASRPAAE